MESYSPVLQAVPVGEFGDSVLEYLSQLGEDVHVTPTTSTFAVIEPSSLVTCTVLIAPSPDPPLCVDIEHQSLSQGVAFVPAIIDGDILRIGPLSIPGSQGCWSCWINRTRQHCTDGRPAKNMSEPLTSGSVGRQEHFWEPQALIAAACVQEVVSALRAHRAASGQIREFNCLTHASRQGVVIGIHGCPVCGLKMKPQSRTYVGLQEALTYLWR
jgi:bacteriocin biosynthesis cyclodehydratase domain-containing protein